MYAAVEGSRVLAMVGSLSGGTPLKVDVVRDRGGKAGIVAGGTIEKTELTPQTKADENR